MKTNSSVSGNVGIQTVALILAVIGIILGIAGIQAAHSSKKVIDDLQLKLDSQTSANEQAVNDIRQLKAQTSSALNMLSQELGAVREQLSKLPPPPPPKEVKDAAKDKGKEPAKGKTTKGKTTKGKTTKSAKGKTTKHQ